MQTRKVRCGVLCNLFAQFTREKQFLNNVSPRTIKFYKDCLAAWKRTVGDNLPDKQNIKEFVMRLQEEGIKVVTINIYIRGINSFLTWLLENEHIPEKLRIKQLKEPEKVLKVFSDEQLKALLSFRPRNYYEQRLYALITLIIDTGIRIDEALSLKRENVLLEDLLIKVCGKGNKERYVPISIECRKVLFRFLGKHNFDLVFPTKSGTKIAQCNAFRDFNELCDELGINGVRTSWHTLRHGYALNHIREGGDVFSLQRILGHSDLSVTKRYVGLTENDLKLIHKKVSILGRLK
jgi:integrase/recombinase XerD